MESDTESISRQFLCMVSSRHFDWKWNDKTCMDCEWQQNFLNATVLHPCAQKYPPSTMYRRYFIKELISKLESAEVEISELVYQTYVNLLQEEPRPFCYKTYILPRGQEVTLRENLALVEDGSTGMTTWQASKVLTQWIVENQHFINGRGVLELGSGLGLLGLAVCKSCLPRRYTFTDCHPQVLNLLGENLQMNLNADQRLNVDILNLDWLNFKTSDLTVANVDIILAADVAYDPTLIPPLVNVLHILMVHSGSTPQVIMAVTQRNPETLQLFHTTLNSRNITATEIPYSPDKFLYNVDETFPTFIYQLNHREVTR